MSLHRCRLRLLVAFALALLSLAASARAAEFPSRPVTLVVPFAAGGPTDTLARMLAAPMGAALGQTVIVQNITGAAGSSAVGAVAHAQPDGYTLSVGNWGTHVLNGALYPLNYDLLRDLAPIALIARNPQLIVARRGMPAADLRGMIDWLKRHPDKASQATSGAGSAAHIAGAFFQISTKTQFQFVPYRGAAPAMQDLIAGRVDLMIDQATNSLPFVRSGQVKAYAVTAATRLAAAPDIPTVDEAGLPGFYISVWHGLWAPRGTPAAVIAKLNAAVTAALADPHVRQQLTDSGNEIAAADEQTPDALGALQKADIEKWWPIINAANIKSE
jgi:tripartite-type tricarboxylate transporter receptor subunit TctC